MRPELRITLPVTLLALVACGDKDPADDTGSTGGGDDTGSAGADDTGEVEEVDADGDGFVESEDCDDTDAAINPGAAEVCDEVDNNCDGEIDEGVTTTYYGDADLDGFGADAAAVEACEQPPDTTDKGGDCDDDDATVYPEATEVCGDGVVNDCLATEADARAACPWEWADDAGDADLTFTGEYVAGRAGASIAAGDVNGDGLEDLLMGAPGATTSESASFEGGAWLFLGGTTASGTLSDADAGGGGGYTRAALGTSVDIVPDLDGDGLDDLLVGAPGDNETTPGAAFIVYGQTTVAFDSPDGTFQTGANSGLGAAVTGLGDVNGDGLGDLLVAAPNGNVGEATNAGHAHLLLGPVTGSIQEAAATWTGSNPYATMGRAVAGAGDVDGDGLNDILVGSPQEEVTEGNYGRVHLISGASSLSGGDATEQAAANLTGDAGWSWFGASIAGMGDVDGDGLDDVIVGAPRYSTSEALYGNGKVYVFTGNPTGTLTGADAAITFTGDTQRLNVGSSVATGDFDADGMADLLIGGADDYTEEASTGGRAYVVLGGASGALDPDDAAHTIDGANIDDGFGAAAESGDFDGDGLDDILVGSPGVTTETAGRWAGAASVFLNGNGY